MLLANRIALLKQEEAKTWKKIDDTKKRTNEILDLKRRNEDRIQKVSDKAANFFSRKSMTTRFKTSSNANMLPTTTFWTSRGRTRRERSKKQFSCPNVRRRSKPKLSRARTIRRNSTRTTSIYWRASWERRRWTSRSETVFNKSRKNNMTNWFV